MCVSELCDSKVLLGSQNLMQMQINFTHDVVIVSTAGETVGEKSSTDTIYGVRLDDLIVNPQRVEDHGGV